MLDCKRRFFPTSLLIPGYFPNGMLARRRLLCASSSQFFFPSLPSCYNRIVRQEGTYVRKEISPSCGDQVMCFCLLRSCFASEEREEISGEGFQAACTLVVVLLMMMMLMRYLL